MVFNSLFPVFVLLVLGYLFKRFRLTDTPFLKTADKLVYFIFFPALLFWKIGGSSPDTASSGNLLLAALLVSLIIFLASSAGIRLFGITAFQAGSFSQSCYRTNTYIGMAVIINALGESGVRYYGFLLGFIIPIINVMSVALMIWFAEHRFDWKERILLTSRALVSNPLIIACLAGLFYSRTLGTFPPFVDNALRLSASIALPMALLSIGAALNLDKLGGHLRPSLLAATFKLVLTPLAGYFVLNWLGVAGTAFKVGMIFFALPTSPAIYVLSSQLSSDTGLASASIVLSTIAAFGTLTAILLLFA